MMISDFSIHFFTSSSFIIHFWKSPHPLNLSHPIPEISDQAFSGARCCRDNTPKTQRFFATSAWEKTHSLCLRLATSNYVGVKRRVEKTHW